LPDSRRYPSTAFAFAGGTIVPAPATIVEFIDLTAKSGVLEKRELDTYLNQLASQPEQPAAPKQLAHAMIRDGMLTTLQAGLLLRGKWKNFVISGKYKLLEHLGSGGMGSIYLCEHIVMRRRVAIKILPTENMTDPVLLERFYREARAVAALDHPNIVGAYDIDHDGDMHFLVLEYVDGANLHSIVERFGPLSVPRAINCILQAADGLQHAHEAGLVHRDVKPGNLLFDRSGTVKILDLGLARFFDDETGQLTRRNDVAHILGTADYVAPEQAIDSSAVDIRGDIYSLGVTFFFLLTGKSPYKDGSISQKLMWHQISQPTPVTQLRPEVPKKVAAILDKMMAKEPSQRYQTPAELFQALAPWDEGQVVPPDREMPQLCRAAATGCSTGRLPQMPRMAAATATASATATVPFVRRWERLMHDPRAKTYLLLGMVALAAAGGAIAALMAGH
jgi:eukaryotic-like serine/threonine-protein kinase